MICYRADAEAVKHGIDILRPGQISPIPRNILPSDVVQKHFHQPECCAPRDFSGFEHAFYLRFLTKFGQPSALSTTVAASVLWAYLALHHKTFRLAPPPSLGQIYPVILPRALSWRSARVLPKSQLSNLCEYPSAPFSMTILQRRDRRGPAYSAFSGSWHS